MVVLRSFILAAALAAVGPAQAHVTIQPKALPSGYQVLRFVVGHGCDDQPTTKISINVPPIVEIARPQPKPGWTLKIEPWRDRSDRVGLITWTGKLPADQFDEFLVLVKLPENARVAVFPTVQSCGPTHQAWTGADPDHPPPSVVITPQASPEGGHDHLHEDKP